ncbi:MAG: M1 family metallopeptidase [Planctomycetes bacterium]|nr:M1 family metallopeptidase [Planctomycetota bacterium]
MSTILHRSFLAVLVTAATVVAQAATEGPGDVAVGQGEASRVPSKDRRAIRRTLPMTKSIRRAFAAETRDSSGLPGPKYWQIETDFDIDAKLEPETGTIVGKERITLHNGSPDRLRELYLRLDHNIFRADVPRGSSVPAETTEGMVVTRIAVDNVEVDLTSTSAGRRRGGRGNRGGGGKPRATALDQTLARISLPEPIDAGATAKIEISWRTKLPGGDAGRGHRMTQRFGDTLFQPTQWFPRLAKYDDLRGWDTNVYLGPAEFYNNFGRFDVRIDVPGGWIVTATGVLENPERVLSADALARRESVLDSDDVTTIVSARDSGTSRATREGDRLTWRYVADSVNDFAWATAKNYVYKGTRANIPGKGPIPIYMVHLPENERMYANAGPIVRHALEFYSKLWIPYPFPQLTMQDGPSLGMEYPMVINSNQGAADHETAHQWWPMTVGTNETWYGWMDEGLNQYMNVLSDADRRNRAPRLDGLGQSYGRRSGDESEPPMMWIANYAGNAYGFQTYGKAPMMLSMLGGIVGDEAVQAAIRAYANAWAFKHPSPWDFANCVSRELGEDLDWFWYYWLWTTESVDGSIQGVEDDGGVAVVTVRQDGEMPSPVVLKFEFGADTSSMKLPENAKRLDEKTIVVTWPVDVWFDGRRTFEARFDHGSAELTRVVFDPQRRFPDRNPSDNFWPAGK